MRDHLRFLLNDEPIEVRDVEPTITLLRWLRETRRLTGTKEGCAAGDCGACTVVVGALGHGGRDVHYHAVNACLAPMASMDGRSIVTVEGIREPDGTLHPAQQAMVDAHGSQCGFCTPGFVMSMVALHSTHATRKTRPSRHDILDALGGNLCRCTGYGPIVDAARRMFDLPSPPSALARRKAEHAALLRFDDLETTCLNNGTTRAYLPRTLDALCDLAAGHPDATIISGATDAGLWITKQARALPVTILASAVREDALFNGTGGDARFWIGGGVTHTEAMAACPIPALVELWRRFAGAQVRNVATIGGNIANGSPIGDLAPALIALDTTLHLRLGRAERTLPLEAFFKGYGVQDRRPGELIVGVSFQRPDNVDDLAFHKVSKRFDDDISAVCGAFNIAVRAGVVGSARIAFGGMAAIPKRAKAVEAALSGKPWTRATIDAALDAFAQDYQPISDMRASAAYRLDVARNLLVRTYIEREHGPSATRLVGPLAAFGG